MLITDTKINDAIYYICMQLVKYDVQRDKKNKRKPHTLYPSVQEVILNTIEHLQLVTNNFKQVVMKKCLYEYKKAGIPFLKYDENYEFNDKELTNMFNEVYEKRLGDEVITYIKTSKIHTTYKMIQQLVKDLKLKYYEDKQFAHALILSNRYGYDVQEEEYDNISMYSFMDGPLEHPIDIDTFENCRAEEDEYTKRPYTRNQHYLSYNSSFRNIAKCLHVILIDPKTKLNNTTSLIVPPNKILYWIVLVGLCNQESKKNYKFSVVINKTFYNTENKKRMKLKLEKAIKKRCT